MRNEQILGALEEGRGREMGREERKAKKHGKRLAPQEGDQLENPSDRVTEGLLRTGTATPSEIENTIVIKGNKLICNITTCIPH